MHRRDLNLNCSLLLLTKAQRSSSSSTLAKLDEQKANDPDDTETVKRLRGKCIFLCWNHRKLQVQVQ